MKVLLVEDNERVTRFVTKGLQEAGHTADHADNGRDGLFLAASERYDVIAMTASLPLYDERFEQMLNIGGRLFVTVGMAPVMDARLVRRTAEDSFVVQSLFETVIDPLVHAARPPVFTF